MSKKANLTKLRIASEAEKLFAKKGFNSTSMEDIMIASAASKGSIYYHFKNKEDLFLFILEQQAINWKETWNANEEEYSTATEKLIGITIHYLNDFKNPLFLAAQEFTFSGSNYEKVLNIYRVQFYDIYKKIFQEGIDSGEFLNESTETYMYTFLGLQVGLDNAYYDNISFEKLQTLYLTATNIFIKGIKTP
ncbi:TetR/AcrR family transcriptional regulator [Robertmurraya korlensis]|uniref:TetR/AcrR family transcriptional regulator n=1 Tax=Robertmurraya korlensis TaxID=519977 RepID=UPI0008255759|nr:TetR/AcrR family transcriptional regulator [Robertmurraya korlensis]